MKTFKVYRKGGAKQNLVWIGAMMVIVGITIASIVAINYFKFHQALVSVDKGSSSLLISELYLSAGLFVFGVVLLIAGGFAAEETKNGDGNKE